MPGARAALVPMATASLAPQSTWKRLPSSQAHSRAHPERCWEGSPSTHCLAPAATLALPGMTAGGWGAQLIAPPLQIRSPSCLQHRGGGHGEKRGQIALGLGFQLSNASCSWEVWEGPGQVISPRPAMVSPPREPGEGGHSDPSMQQELLVMSPAPRRCLLNGNSCSYLLSLSGRWCLLSGTQR